MPGRLLAILVAFVLVVGGVVAAAVWTASRPEELGEVGDVLELSRGLGPDSSIDLALAHEVDVRVPGGVVVLRVGEPVRELPDGTPVGDVREVDRTEFGAPDGAVYLPLEWDLQQDGSSRTVSGSTDDELDELIDLAVRTGDTVTELDPEVFDDPGSHPGLNSVALVLDEDDVDSATVEVLFDGEPQSVTVDDGSLDPGLAAPLYDLEPDGAVVLPSGALTGTLPRGFGSDPGETAVRGVEYLPWLPDRGWVEEPGTAWCRVDLTTLLDPGFEEEPESRFGYRMRLAGHTETLDGGAPVDADLEVLDGSENTKLAVTGTVTWLVDDVPRELMVSHDLEVVRSYDDQRPLHRFSMSGTLDVHAAALGPA